MKILIAAAEISPLTTTLPRALKDFGFDVRVILPQYKTQNSQKISGKKITSNLDIPVGTTSEKGEVHETFLPASDVPTYLLGSNKYFGESTSLTTAPQAAFFSHGVIELLRHLGWQPNILHAHNWQTAQISTYLKTLYKEDGFFQGTATVLSFDDLTQQKNLELLKDGLTRSDIIGTTSKKYTKEVQTPEYGHGLDPLFSQRSADLYGIIGGIDYRCWNPATDKKISRNYSQKTLARKNDNKKELQKICKLPHKRKIPLLAMISRLTDQKGSDILTQAIDEIMKEDLQLILLGTGEQKYRDLFLRVKEKYPKKFSLNPRGDSSFVHQIYAGADMLLIPSRSEPYAATQLIGFCYGTIPIVRATGSLADTVRDFDPQRKIGDGFAFKEYSAPVLHETIKRALATFKNKKNWKALQTRIMRHQFSWALAAKKYLALYKKALEKVEAEHGIKIPAHLKADQGPVIRQHL